MTESLRLPDPGLVHSLYRRGLRTQIIRMALLLDVFSPMAKGPADVQAVAKACDCSTIGMGLLLEYLSSFGVLEHCDGRFQLTPTAATFFVPARRSYVGEWVLEQTNPDVFREALQSIRSGVPFRRSVPWEQRAWLESYDRSRIRDSLAMWEAVGIKPGQYAGLRVLDLACGSSITSFALAQCDSSIRVTCVDSPRVLEVAKDLANRLEVIHQAIFVPGDLSSLELGESRYDIVLLGNVTNFFTAQQNMDLFRRVWRVLMPAGFLVINVTMACERADEHTSLYSLILWTFSGTKFHSFDDYRIWLKDAGFSGVARLGKLWLSARK